MRIPIMLLTFVFYQTVLATSDRQMNELFKNYQEILLDKNTDKIEEVFSKKFLARAGGKNAFVEKISDYEVSSKEKSKIKKVSWKKGKSDEIYFVKFGPKNDTEFIVILENGKLKIDGTASDATE